MLDDTFQRVCAYVDLDALAYNVEQMKKNVAPETKIVGVIKTDGYGHGAIQMARVLEEIDYVWGYAVATPEEAMLLRNAGIRKPVLILGYTFPYAYPLYAEQDIRPAVFTEEMLQELSDCSAKQKKNIKVHLKVDTGMSRIGIRPDAEGLAFVKKALSTSGIEVEGIFTHFARADETEKQYAEKQYHMFLTFVTQIEQETGVRIPLVHCSNSAGIVEMPYANMNLVRAGIILYGLWPSDQVSKEIVDLKPILSLKSHVVYVKTVPAGTQISYGGTYVAEAERVIATIPVGYGDGYPRGLSNTGYVLIHGKKAPIVGRVCMDQFMVDVTDIQNVLVGDEVTLIGSDGQEKITVEELGELSGRFNYELVCDLGPRIPRVYLKNGIQVDVKKGH